MSIKEYAVVSDERACCNCGKLTKRVYTEFSDRVCSHKCRLEILEAQEKYKSKSKKYNNSKLNDSIGNCFHFDCCDCCDVCIDTGIPGDIGCLDLSECCFCD